MLSHASFDAGVVAEALQKAEGARGVREVGEREHGVEGVGCFVLDFAPVSGAAGSGGLDGGEARGGAGEWRGPR